MRRHRLLVSLVAVPATLLLALCAAVPASASSPEYLRYTLSAKNVPIVGLPSVKVYPSASVLVPRSWKVLSRRAASITFKTDKSGCPYRVTFRTRWATGATMSAAEHVTAAVPAKSAAYVQDWGTRRSYAWRVARGAQSRLDGMQAVVMQERPASLPNTAPRFPGLPAGQSVFRELIASAPTYRAGSECHSGHYREVGRQIGDALAVNVTSSK